MKASEFADQLRPRALKFARESRQTLLLTSSIETITGRPCPAGHALGVSIRRGVLDMIQDAKQQEARIRASIATGGDWDWEAF